jgi:hypothetical protein
MPTSESKKRKSKVIGAHQNAGPEPPPPWKLKYNKASLTDMKTFFNNTDWMVWWEDFYLSIGFGAESLYRTVRQFAKRKAKSQEQFEFLLWVCGPGPQDPQNPTAQEKKLQERWPFAKPMNWYQKRETGGWFSPEAILESGKTVKAKLHALESLKEAGDLSTLPFLFRLEALAQQLDKEFQGRLFLPRLSTAENESRARLYLSLLERIMQMKATADNMYARSLGVNLDDMDGLTRLLTISLGARAIEEQSPENKRLGTALTAINSMMLQKAAKHGTPLPAGTGEVLDITLAPKKRKDVQ